MTCRFLAAARCGAAVSFSLIAAAHPAFAQRKQAPEFTQQFLYVANFWVAGKTTPSYARADMRFGRRVADGVRDKLEDLVNKREAKVISGSLIRNSLELSSMSTDTALSTVDLRRHGEFFRADELITFFNQARQPKEQAAALDQVIKFHSEFEKPETQLQPIIASIE